MSGSGRSSLGRSSVDMSRVPNSAANSSGPSVGASSLVTDANSALSGGPQLQHSASFNTDSYMRPPASPMSFSSNNISGSSMVDGSSIMQSPRHEQLQKQGASSASSHPTNQEQDNLLHAQKRARIDLRQDDVVPQQVLQQLLQRQDSLQLQGHPNPQLQAIIQQQRLAQRQQQQQQLLQSLPPMQRVQLQQHQLRQQLLQQSIQPAIPVKRPLDSGICSRRLMQYIYHKRNRPSDNSIHYWRKFVLEYFAPRARRRWCMSVYDSANNHALGVFPRVSTDAWSCGICGSKSGKGFEATCEVFARLNQIKFDRGAIDELLFLEMPQEFRLPTGLLVLEYAKAVQETIYEQLRVIREGHLRIVFTPELKIISWEFCTRHHEEFFSRRSIAPQVNQLLQVAHKYQTAVNEAGPSGVSPQDLQSNCNMFVAAGRQLARNLELQNLNELGFSKRFIRCLQISEVVSSMKDLIDFSREHKTGPIESLKNYPKQVVNQKMQEADHIVNQCLSADVPNLMNKISASSPVLTNNINGVRVTNNTQSALPLGNYQNILRNNMMITNNSSVQPVASGSFSSPNQSHQLSFNGPVSSSLVNSSNNALSGPQHQQQNYLHPSQGNQHLQQHAIQQLLHGIASNRGAPQQSAVVPNGIGNVSAEVLSGFGSMQAGINSAALRNATGVANGPANIIPNQTYGATPSRSNSFKSVANQTVSGSSYNSRPELAEYNMEFDQDITQEFGANGMFNGEAADMYGWKL